MDRNALGVALIRRQVMLVQAARSHTPDDPWLDVYVYVPFGDRVFISTDNPHARVSSANVLAIFPTSMPVRTHDAGMLELPQRAYLEFTRLNDRFSTLEAFWARSLHVLQ